MDDDRLAEIEYESLYKEIDKHSDRIFVILNFAIVAVTTVLGFAFNMTPSASTAFGSHVPAAPVLFLLPLFIVCPSILLVASELNSITRIANHIRVFYESRTSSIAWQNKIQEIRRKHTKKEPTRYLLRALDFLLPALAIICIMFSVLSGITASVGRDDFSSFPYMLVTWTAVLGLVLYLLRELNKAWHWSRFQLRDDPSGT